MRFMYESILLEDIEAVKKQYSYIPEDDFYTLIKLDPTFKDGSNSVGKYGKWLLGLYRKDNPLNNYNPQGIYNLLDMYNDYKNDRTKNIEKDINRFKSVGELADAVRNVGEAELSARQKERELRNAYKDAELVFSDDMWQIWIPETYAASCTLGKGTTWCTAYSNNDSWYKDYTSQGPLYVFINKQDPKEKYQLHIETSSFMNSYDEPYDLNDVLDTDDKLRKFVEDELGVDADSLVEMDDEVLAVIEAIGVTPIEARQCLDNDEYYVHYDIEDYDDLGRYLVYEHGWLEIYDYVDELDSWFDYGQLGIDIDDNYYENDEGEQISAGEYWCGNENARYEEIGRAYADGISLSDIYNLDRYLDYDAIGRDANDFYLTPYGCVEVLY